MRFKLMMGCWLVAVCTQASAEGLLGYLDDFKQAKTEGKATALIGVDNDTLMLNRNDGFYTSGLRFTQQYVQRDADKMTTFGWRIGQNIYTASDIKLSPQSISSHDHPYAGWLYDGFFKEVHRVDGSHLKYGLDVGCMGRCSGAEKVQTIFHRLSNQPAPQGWGTQMKNEVGAVLYADSAPMRWKATSWLDVTPNFHGRFGNIFTDVGGGLTLRAGELSTFPGQSTLHGLLRLDASAIGYNAMLQGGYFSRNNPHTVKPRRWVGEAELGLVWNHAPYGVSVSVVRRSNEIGALSNGVGAQNFVRLMFSYTP